LLGWNQRAVRYTCNLNTHSTKHLKKKCLGFTRNDENHENTLFVSVVVGGVCALFSFLRLASLLVLNSGIKGKNNKKRRCWAAAVGLSASREEGEALSLLPPSLHPTLSSLLVRVCLFRQCRMAVALRQQAANQDNTHTHTHTQRVRKEENLNEQERADT
jgi:hypothetical protein